MSQLCVCIGYLLMSKIDFLKPNTEEIRHQIRGILDSYSHDWDLISELTQNAVDTILEAKPEKGRIELHVDATGKRISILDNGTGINPAHIERLLRPFGTDKSSKPNLIGEKGVGLKFVIFPVQIFAW